MNRTDYRVVIYFICQRSLKDLDRVNTSYSKLSQDFTLPDHGYMPPTSKGDVSYMVYGNIHTIYRSLTQYTIRYTITHTCIACERNEVLLQTHAIISIKGVTEVESGYSRMITNAHTNH